MTTSRSRAHRGVAVAETDFPVIRGKTHYAASLMSAHDQQIPDDTRVVLEELITETGRCLANIGMDNGTQLTAHAMRGWRLAAGGWRRISSIETAFIESCLPVETSFSESLVRCDLILHG